MKCKVDIPYPKIMIKKKNPQMARMIMHSYAGDVSEDTAIHQYMFQSIVLQKETKEVAEILEQIAIVEKYLPKMLSREEIAAIIAGFDDKSIPNVMKHFKANFNGQVDMRLVQEILKG